MSDVDESQVRCICGRPYREHFDPSSEACPEFEEADG